MSDQVNPLISLRINPSTVSNIEGLRINLVLLQPYI